MALQPITHTEPSPVPDAPQGDISSPAGMPNYDGKSPEEMAQIIGQMSPGGDGLKPTPDPEQQAQQAGQPKVSEQKPAEPGTQIPDKFKNADGSPNIEALIKSQADGQSYALQNKNEVDRLRSENDQLLKMGEDFQREIQYMKTAGPQTSQPGSDQMSDKEIEEYNANPKAYMAKMMKEQMGQLNQKVEGQRAEGQRDRMMDFKVNAALSNIKNKEGYKELEADINGILNSNLLGYDPRGPEMAYHAAVGMRMPQIIAEAKNQAFTAGYEKHKEELTKQVTGGGGSTLPAGGPQLDDQTIDGMTPEQMVAAGIVNVHPSK